MVEEPKVSKLIAALLISLWILGLGCSQDPDHQVLAKVNKTKITAADLEREITELPFHSRSVLMNPEGQKKLLDEMIKRELLLQEADHRGLASDPEIKARLDAGRRNVLLGSLLTQEIRDKVKITDEEVKVYFDRHRDELETSEVHLKQILLQDAKEAEEIRARLLKNEEFERLARQLSADRNSAGKGGDLGFVSRGQMLPELERVAFSLKPQEISEIVKTPRGYHILKMVERKKPMLLKYEEVKDRLRPFAETEKQRERLESWLDELRKKAHVKVYEARLPLSLKGMSEPSKGDSEIAPKAPATPSPPSHPPSRK